MANLTRYNLWKSSTRVEGKPFVSPQGEWVKFEDVKELLKPAQNSDYAAALSTVCMLARSLMDEASYKKYLSLSEALRASIAKRNCA